MDVDSDNSLRQEMEEVAENKPRDEKSAPFYRRRDVWLMVAGMVFILILMAAMFGLGIWRGWDAPSGYSHDASMTSSQRFLPEPGENDTFSYVRGRSDRPDAAGQWYYWKCKPDDVTTWTRLATWVGYLTHQIAVWIIVYLAQCDKATAAQVATSGEKPKKYTSRLGRFNWAMFGVNVFFHLFHLLQTHLTYDALAQDVTITSSQGSVIMLLMLVMLLEYNERGIFLGWPTARHTGRVSRKLRLNAGPTKLIRKYHGYAFLWAAVYTFWYHPMENTYGHALGFIYTWILMLQGSLMFSPIHLNRWWRLILEAWVVVHGGLVAVQTGNPAPGYSLWPMFVFGFSACLALTWIFILPFWKKAPTGTHTIPFILWVVACIASYGFILDPNGKAWVRLQEVVRIPLIMYAGFFVVWLALYIFLWIDKKIYPEPLQSSVAVRVLNIVGALTIYMLMVALAIVIEITEVPLAMFVTMSLLIVVFLLGVAIAAIMCRHILPTGNVQTRNDITSDGIEPVLTEEKVRPI